MAEARTLPTEQTTDLVSFEIMSQGEVVPAVHQLLGLTISNGINKIPYAVLIYKDGDPAAENFSLSSQNYFKPGNEIEVKLGYHQDLDSVFKGIVVKHGISGSSDHGSILKIECKHEAAKLTVLRKHRFFSEMEDGEIIEEIIRENGLTPDIPDTSAEHGQMVQYYATDWDFVLSRAEMNGLVTRCDADTIKLFSPEIGEPVLSLLYGSTMLDFEAEMDSRHQSGSVTTTSWNSAKQETDETGGAGSEYGQAGNITEDDLAESMGVDTTVFKHGGGRNESELKSWADAVLVKSRLAKIQGKVKCRGFSSIQPGDTCSLAGLGDRFNGPVFVSAVSHEYAGGAWYTHLRLGLSPTWFYKHEDIVEKPAAGQLPSVNGLQIGIVTALEGDPAGEERIQVRLPVAGSESNGLWMRVATLDAGNERGTVFRPEIGDEVIVGFIENDPRDAVILGMLHSSAHPAPIEASDDNHKKGYTSREKLELIFDDENKSICLETPGGNKIRLSDDEQGILLEDQNGNKIELGSNGITLETNGDMSLKSSGNMEVSGMNVSINAESSLSAEGGSGAELSSSGITEIKGSLVKIN